MVMWVSLERTEEEGSLILRGSKPYGIGLVGDGCLMDV